MTEVLDMKKTISIISSVIVCIYGILNVVSIVFYYIFDWSQAGKYVELILTMDLLTWHVFGIFSAVTLIIKIFWRTEAKKDVTRFSKLMSLDIVLHFIFFAVSFISIWILFKNAF